MNSGTVLPILSLGYNIIQLEGIDNKQLFKDIIENKDKKNDPNYKEIVLPDADEETILPDTIESKKLLNMVHNEIMKINKYFIA